MKGNRSLQTTIVTSDPVNDLDELSHIMLNLRHHTKLWNEHFGANHRMNKKRWEEKADEWLENHTKKQSGDENN